jgi:hypothetical protein
VGGEDDEKARPPDIEIGARVRARSVRFEEKPETEVKHLGDYRAATLRERENLPDEVEPGVTYEDVRVRWHTGVRIEEREP